MLLCSFKAALSWTLTATSGFLFAANHAPIPNPLADPPVPFLLTELKYANPH